jgi:hypothetical protein
MEDAGVSAFRGRNAATGALRGFLDACEQKRVRPGSCLIVENLDRLSRDETLDAVMLFLSILNALAAGCLHGHQLHHAHAQARRRSRFPTRRLGNRMVRAGRPVPGVQMALRVGLGPRRPPSSPPLRPRP